MDQTNTEDNDSLFFKKTTDIPSSILPAHCINVFIPLVDVGPENGATQFCLGSHFHTKFFSDDIVWQDDRWKDRIGFKGDTVTIKVLFIRIPFRQINGSDSPGKFERPVETSILILKTY